VAKRTIWQAGDQQIKGQANTLLLKNPYDASQGEEDLSGFVERLYENSKSYIGHHVPAIFGLKASENLQNRWGWFVLLVVALSVYLLVLHWQKSDFWTFTGMYLAVACGTSFIVLQVYWNQERLILVFAPLLLTYLLYALYVLVQEKLQKGRGVLVAVLAILLLANTGKTAARLPAATEAFGHYLRGDRLYGFTQDWVNYLSMAAWCADHLDEDAYVAARKPGMAFIYAHGKPFHGIWKVPSEDPEELYRILKEAGVTHVIMANLLINPNDPSGRTINTVRRYLSLINQRYPGKLTLVHQIGEQWPAFLYKID
jgi:hypothetical protein